MTPTFKDTLAWQQAELLLQPAFIRLIDNIRKQLDESTWKGSYRDVEIWPEGTTDITKATVTELRQRLTIAHPDQAEEIQDILDRLPSPHPGYELCLELQDRQVSVDLWELCYQICFLDYVKGQKQPIQIDQSLIDEMGEVDWQVLESKTKTLVEGIFANLPKP